MARVMIVDDSPTDRVNLREQLLKAGHVVIEAQSGTQALTMVKDRQPDIVVMDVVMPGINGYHATRMISKDPSTSNIPIIIASSKSLEIDRLWALRQGAKDYVVKPIKFPELLNKINALTSA